MSFLKHVSVDTFCEMSFGRGVKHRSHHTYAMQKPHSDKTNDFFIFLANYVIEIIFKRRKSVDFRYSSG